MNNELIFAIKNIFPDGNDVESVFYATKTNRFYIGPYQRSYKWRSEEEFDQVPQLLNDVYDAWRNEPQSEYFLQYITVKADTANLWLEVIDGQQRLTTLSLLFYQLAEMTCHSGNLNGGGILNASYNSGNRAADKLIYSRYDAENVFDMVCDYCSQHDEAVDKDFEAQDMYYMVAASLYIRKRLSGWRDEGVLDQIINYLLNNVKIIVNIESNFVQSEEIFANLNDNHVPLTDAYLIKGLLITNAVNRVNAYGRSLEYTEIQEKRKNLGRMWDEIQTWISDVEHSLFFYLRHIWHPIIPSFYSNPANNLTAYAWTYVYSPKAQRVGAQVEFYTYSRSGNEKGPKAGAWDRRGSKVWVNGSELAAPVWN